MIIDTGKRTFLLAFNGSIENADLIYNNTKTTSWTQIVGAHLARLAQDRPNPHLDYDTAMSGISPKLILGKLESFP